MAHADPQAGSAIAVSDLEDVPIGRRGKGRADREGYGTRSGRLLVSFAPAARAG